ncbi:MAG: Transporter, CPA2 family [Candidatus Levybacteria bacterium GW2011_GWA2_40_8]|nr:MAG: Transporter, CPA2 family [Candidatus Levybacteria bacterium GW2011_GWA2_40_8]
MGSIYTELTLIIVLAAGLSIFFRFLRQPPILAYILAGVILGPLGIIHLQGKEVITSLAEIGITLLLFMLGLELRFSELKSVGKVSIITGLAQILFTSVVGYSLSIFLGFSPIVSLYVSIALTFSSTIIIVKLLSDKKDLQSLYGKISVGFLLVQDFVAIVALIFLSGFTGGGPLSFLEFFTIILKAVVLFGWVILLSWHFLPYLINKISHSPETLFLFSIAWAFGLSALVTSPLIGFSIEIGGFLAGLALANSLENYQIISRVRPLRDFFITIFFVTLGTRLLISDFSEILIPGVILSAFVLIGNPIIVMIIMGVLGYRKRTGFMAGLTVAQISEFSLILMIMGNRIGHVSDQAVSLVTFVGAITFVISTYMILNNNYLYKLLSPFLDIFERSNVREKRIPSEKIKDHVVLIGVRRMGESILEALKKDEKTKIVAVDFNPDIVETLKEDGVISFYGDIADEEIQELAQIDKAKLIISTVSDLEDNLLLLKSIKNLKKKPKVVLLALEKHEARELYKEGADYVVIPHIAGGHHLAKILVEENHMELIEKYKEKDMKDTFS